MKKQDFISLLEKLDDATWQAVIEGQALLLVDDVQLVSGDAQSANAIIRASENMADSKDLLRQKSLEEAGEILANYYLTHPLTLHGFNLQAKQLLEKYGMAAFAAAIGELPEYTLFVEGGEVVAEPATSPRHRYGVFCELGHSVPLSAVDEQVKKWLDQGEAHERYLGMNVCRYNC